MNLYDIPTTIERRAAAHQAQIDAEAEFSDRQSDHTDELMQPGASCYPLSAQMIGDFLADQFDDEFNKGLSVALQSGSTDSYVRRVLKEFAEKRARNGAEVELIKEDEQAREFAD